MTKNTASDQSCNKAQHNQNKLGDYCTYGHVRNTSFS